MDETSDIGDVTLSVSWTALPCPLISTCPLNYYTLSSPTVDSSLLIDYTLYYTICYPRIAISNPCVNLNLKYFPTYRTILTQHQNQPRTIQQGNNNNTIMFTRALRPTSLTVREWTNLTNPMSAFHSTPRPSGLKESDNSTPSSPAYTQVQVQMNC